MNYVRVNDGVIEYPFYPATLMVENPQVSFPREMSETLLAEYGVYKLELTQQPTTDVTQVAVEVEPVLLAGKWTQQWEVRAAPIPTSITPRQCRLILSQQGLLSQVEALIAQQDEATRITWEYALEFRRDDPLLVQLADDLTPPLTSAQIDQFFIAAAQL